MAGEVVDISVDYVIDTPEGPERVTVNLTAMTQHCRPERVEDLIEDAALLAEDVIAGQHPESGRPVLAVIRGHR
jgi:hypothetical protein